MVTLRRFWLPDLGPAAVPSTTLTAGPTAGEALALKSVTGRILGRGRPVLTSFLGLRNQQDVLGGRVCRSSRKSY